MTRRQLWALLIAAAAVAGCGDARRRTGPTAKSLASAGQLQETLADGRKCTSDLDGTGFCSSGTEISFCQTGRWVVLDCAQAASQQGGDGWCYEDDKAKTVDCKVQGGADPSGTDDGSGTP